MHLRVVMNEILLANGLVAPADSCEQKTSSSDI